MHVIFRSIVAPILLFSAVVASVVWHSSTNSWYSLPPQTIFTAVGLVSVLFTYILTNYTNSKNDQRQFSLKVLFDYRFSSTYRNDLLNRQHYFPRNMPVDADYFWQCFNARFENEPPTDDPDKAATSAEAVIHILNFYEFVCIGIKRNDLDEMMMKESIRGMMCAFVSDFRDVIISCQNNHPLTYKHLVSQYNMWKDPKQDAINLGQDKRSKRMSVLNG